MARSPAPSVVSRLHTVVRAWAPLVVLTLLACGDEPSEPDAGSLGPDARAADARPADAAPADTGAPLDLGVLDAGAPDVPEAPDVGFEDAGHPDAEPPPVDGGPPPPERVLFIGNSFTLQGPVPRLVEEMARYAGFDPLEVDFRAVGGRTLAWHRDDTTSGNAPSQVIEGWDAVVLQEFSTRPTDQVGPAEEFKIAATWFHDLARDTNPQCQVVLYETWARHANHGIYPGTFSDPAQMQAELRFHYDDAADRYIPMNTTSTHGADVRVARVGDAWESQLSGGEPPMLHGSDLYHAGSHGQYLNALVLYTSLFGRRADGMVPLNGVDAATAQVLQDTADGVNPTHGWGARRAPPLAIPNDDPIPFDFGPSVVAGWPALPEATASAFDLPTESGAPSSVYVTAYGFTGTQTGGATNNGLGLPEDVSRDTLWVGTFDGHAAALDLEAYIVVRGLPPGTYRLTLFASRLGDDGARGRRTRYEVGGQTQDLEVADNLSSTVVFDSLALDRRGELVVRVTVSPSGTGRFAYAGVGWVTRTGD